MYEKQKISEIIKNYDLNNLSIATVCSHSSLQIFDGARKEGLKTIGICVGSPPKFYDAFPKAKPDEYIVVESYKDIPKITDELISKNAIIIPHGSFVEYLGADNFANLQVPTFGNRAVLSWESDREKERTWLESAGVSMPKEINPEEISSPSIVKYHGAKGGMGFFIVDSYEEFKKKINPNEKYTIQEFIIGTRFYLHYFYSPIKNDGYALSKGTLEMLGMDKRIESNIDELYRVPDCNIDPTFTVTGNLPLVARESLLPKIFQLGEQVVEKSIELFGGMVGAFCLETIFTDKLEIKVFEISARIVAGTNIYPSGSPYSDFIEENLSTGRRIAKEINLAKSIDKMDEIIS